ncbi:hypothetical protein Mycsm_06244 [Mycobacterium sp. JS623]|nr:hypothetical protein Mycsm_06244 [Mycobacterium sp. JS623]
MNRLLFLKWLLGLLWHRTGSVAAASLPAALALRSCFKISSPCAMDATLRARRRLRSGLLLGLCEHVVERDSAQIARPDDVDQLVIDVRHR